MKRSVSRHLLASLGAAAVCASVLAGAPTAALAQDVAPAPEGTGLKNCAGTYQVLDAARAGALSLPARAYTLATTVDLNCDEAARGERDEAHESFLRWGRRVAVALRLPRCGA